MKRFLLLSFIVMVVFSTAGIGKDKKILQCVKPTAYTVSGVGALSLCAGATGVSIKLSSSQTGVTYQLKVGTANQGTPLTGTGSALVFTNQTVAGVYTILATNTTTGCTNTMSGSATVTVNALPTAFDVAGGGAICAGATGVTITLSGSQSGVQYQLVSGGVNQGTAKSGTGAALSFTGLTVAGVYTIVATNTSTTCSKTMNLSATVTVNPLPTLFTVGGSGTICTGSSTTITLSGSQTGVNYQLLLGTVNQGAPLAGTGSALSFANQTAAGTYTVVATNATTSCKQTMTGNAVVAVSALPTLYTVGGSGTICTGATSLTITLSGSQTATTYQLMRGTTAVGTPITGTGSALNFTGQSVSGTYTIVATSAAGCQKTMTGSATITNNMPALFTVAGGGTICSGASTTITLSGSETGVNYQLLLGTTNQGTPVAGTGSALSFANLTAAGTYTVVATNATTSCKQTMTGSIAVVVNALPTVYTVGGSGTICTGATSLTVTLSGSQTATTYQLMRGTTAVGTPITGTGSALNFTGQSISGTYTIVATSAAGCQKTMTGSATITNNMPTLYTVSGSGIICTGSSTTVTLSGSQTGVNYQLLLGTTNQGTPIAGTGSALSFANLTAAGTYTVVATNATTSCKQTMTGSVVTTVNALPTLYTVSGGGTICTGATSLSIALSGSQTATTYQLMRGTTAVGTPITGTGSALSFTGQSITGSYTVIATNAAGCKRTMTGSATITNNMPTLFTVAGGGAICSGASTTITLSGSQTGVNYQLLLGTTNQGTPIAGTGSALSFANLTAAGTYTVAATNATTSCKQTMTGSAVITVNALPTLYTVSGGGTICTGTTSMSIALSGSQTATTYQLMIGTTAVGTPITGTGAALSFTGQSVSGTYTIVATSAAGCQKTMTGTATITNNLPTLFAVGGSATICSGSPTAITLSGSQTGVNYQLLLGTVNQGSPVAGTGLALSFANQTAAGTYTVMATNAVNGCKQTMTGNAVVVVNALPTQFPVAGGGTICTGMTNMTVTLNGSQTATTYQLMRGTTAVGTPITGTGSTINFAGQTVSGTYTIIATNSVGCQKTMAGSATVINNLPSQFVVSGGGTFCAGSSAIISLSGSETGMNYQLMLGSTNVGSPMVGTGSSISFANQTASGNYTVVATNPTAGCSQPMVGSASIVVNDLPTLYNVGGGGYVCPGSTTTITLSGSQTGVNYQLALNASNQGTPIAGTGSAISFTNLTLAGTYTIVASNPTTSCTLAMTGSVIVTDNLSVNVFDVSGGGSICASANASIMLSGSQTGMSYQLVLGTTNQGDPIIGTGSALTFANQSLAGNYSVVATDLNSGCIKPMNGSATISIKPQPTTFDIGGSVQICIGENTPITLSGSQTGVNYQLVLGSTNQGESVAGTGSALTFANQTSAGIYTIVATGSSTGCVQPMAGSATVSFKPQPLSFNVTGGGAICVVESTSINLSGSESGVNYQLVRDNANQQTPLAGTGSALNFVNQNTAGTYTIVATGTTSGCAQAMTGSAAITIKPQPTIFKILGGGPVCTGSAISVTLSGSQAAVSYQLMRDNVSQSTMTGTGSAIAFTNVTDAGTYTIVATALNCAQQMDESVTVSLKPLPETFNMGSKITDIKLSGSVSGDSYQLQRNGINFGTALTGTGNQLKWLYQQPGTYRVKATNSVSCSVFMTGDVVLAQPKIAEEAKVTRNGVLPTPPQERQFMLSSLNQGEALDLFQAPPCWDGNYRVAFQLYYDLGDKQTTNDWLSALTVVVMHGDDSLTALPLQLNSKNQTFISTRFFDNLVACAQDYRFVIAKKLNLSNGTISTTGIPQENIYLRLLFYKTDAAAFDPAAQLQLSCNYNATQNTLLWNYSGMATEYDLEWVYIADYENFSGTTATEAFQFKEPARITTAGNRYDHLIFYPNGKIWYRARAISYNPAYPDHRIQGLWFYSSCEANTFSNQQPDKNWTEQTVFAEEGKYKKVLHYFDGSLRERQTQTNLSSNGTTLIGESLYDFEGRKAVDILPFPFSNNTLTFYPGLNPFTPIDQVVTQNTQAGVRSKFNYDNYRLENSILVNGGSGQYYSPNSPAYSMNQQIHSNYIPDGQGYVYSQTEFTNDGTGRIRRQSGVGQAFRIDGDHTTRHYYGAAAATELIRLFGNNVGNASHYKKNMVVDANGQVNVTYLDQEERTIATALAGSNPANVDALDSYKNLSLVPVTVDISSKNALNDGSLVIAHTLTNTVPDSVHFRYSMAAIAAQVESLGCKTCTYDLTLSITNPDGAAVDLSAIPGNQSPDGSNYLLTNLTAASCTDSLKVKDLKINVLLSEIGDYSITKRLTPHDLTFETMQDIITQDPSVQVQMQQVRNGYVADASQCDICTQTCPETEQLVQTAIEETSAADCQNIYNQIVSDLQSQHSDDPEYVPTDNEIKAHPSYCQYQLCVKDQNSDNFGKQMSRYADWSAAVTGGYTNAIDLDPFFNNAALSGYNYKAAMQSQIGDVQIATINYDTNNDGTKDGTVTYHGPLSQVIDPNNTNFYIDANGLQNANGKHILYIDLFNKRAQLGETAFLAQLDVQRWRFYKSFYDEAKRKVKITIPDYAHCAPALALLKTMDNVPTDPAQLKAFNEANGAGTQPSDADISTSVATIKMACDIQLSQTDSVNVANHLHSYFTNHPNNFFHLIINTDATTDADLMAVNSILSTYHCSLDSVAQVDPMACKKDTTFTVSKIMFDRPQSQVNAAPVMAAATLASPMMASESVMPVVSTETTVANSASPRAAFFKSMSHADSLKIFPQASIIKTTTNATEWQSKHEADTAGQSRSMQEELDAKNVKAEYLASLTQQGQAKTSMQSQAIAPQRFSVAMAAIAPVIPPPSQEEYNALLALYNATNGADWTNNTGWSTASSTPQSVAGWYGVYVDSLGHVNSIGLQENNLTGSLPDLSPLTSLSGLTLQGNHLTGAFPSLPSSMKALILDNNQLTGSIPSSIGQLTKLVMLSVGSNQFSGALPAALGSLNLIILDLSYNQFTGSIPSGTSSMFSWLNNNQLSGDLPATLAPSSPLAIQNNKFTFSNFMGMLPRPSGSSFPYSPQALIDSVKTLKATIGQPFVLSTSIDMTTNPASFYQWFKYVDGVNDIPLNANPASYHYADTLSGLTLADNGSQYYYKVKNNGAASLTLTSNLQTLTVVVGDTSTCGSTLAEEYHALMDLYASTNGAQWKNNRGWKDANPNVVCSVQGWYGVNTDANGHVIHLDLDGTEDFSYVTNRDGYQVYPGNNLSGTLPSTIGNLKCLQTLNLAGNHLTDTIPGQIGRLTNLNWLILSFNRLSGTIPSSVWNLTKLNTLYMESNLLTGGIPAEVGNLTHLWSIQLMDNQLSGAIPKEFGSLKELQYLHLYDNNFSGSIPPELGSMTALVSLGLYRNQLSGTIPSELGDLKNLAALFVGRNNLTGSVPASIATIPNLQHLYLDSCRLSGPIPTAIGNLPLYYVGISNNKFTFADLVPFRQNLVSHNFIVQQLQGNQLWFLLKQSPNALGSVSRQPYTSSFDNIAQDSVDVRHLYVVEAGSNKRFMFTAKVDTTTTPPSSFEWYRSGARMTPPSNQGHTYTVSPITLTSSGQYTYAIRNSAAPELTLYSRPQNMVAMYGDTTITICLSYDSANATLKNFSYTVDLNEQVQQCMARAAKTDSIVTEYAIAKLMEQEVTTLYNTYSTRCIESVKEKLTYSYTSKEYHYTLYYYDQAGNLVQTVPPKGVHPLTPEQLASATPGNIINPEHTLVTRYQYNSINQLESEVTPDAGTSTHWYNDKGQLRLSQNAQQKIENAYSFTQYDEQGRTVQAGEIRSQLPTAVTDSLNTLQFPNAQMHTLKDVTITHYDEADSKIQKQFAQQNLRSRVSYVEVTDATRTDTVRTHYSYDLHGNVKTLLQSVPGMKPKRTEYVYDLVSGKMDYVFFQFNEADQFSHRYSYDADNRITLVETSSDRYLWNTEANYRYYLHGPLARTELGQYRVQGLDYYYTLQGWIKGVNMPYAGDPGVDGTNGSAVGKDVFAYSLGYYNGDYAPINNSVVTNSVRDQLWNRALENIQHTGLYNGNISWMVTDLTKIGQVNHNRTKGMQGMLYRYDQLHRITQSRSLTDYSAANGFATRPTTNAYDEDYVYDANGNITSLKRNDELAALKDDFVYDYYASTNRLKQHKVNGGLYEYDAIGNLTRDENEGVVITWTPYGKVRTVQKGDSVTVSYRYDASGNRVEKKVVKNSVTMTTNYLRDASGNVMSIYRDTLATEIPIYGSARLGEYKGDVTAGAQTLGRRNYELSNHLGNVLTVITDNVQMNADSTWAKVVSASDYHPFGLEMKGRSWTDPTINYRYGFNGKEKDNAFAGTANYDYGFRIYDPTIGKFLSVDPLTKSYPMLTPYQFASNRPIDGIDQDGLEWSTSGKVFIGPVGYVEYRTVKLNIVNKNNLVTDPKIIQHQKEILKASILKDFQTGTGTIDNPIVYVKIIESKNATITYDLVDAIPIMKNGVLTGYITGITNGGIGNTKVNNIEVSTTSNGHLRTDQEIGRTASHETGHSLGLKHPFHGAKEKDLKTDNKTNSYDYIPNPTWKNNLMNSGGGGSDPKKSDYNPVKGTSGHEVTPQQQETIRKTIK